MPKLIITLTADVTSEEADTLVENSIKLYYDDHGLYVSCYGAPRRIYPDAVDAHVDREEPLRLGGVHNLKVKPGTGA